VPNFAVNGASTLEEIFLMCQELHFEPC